MANDDSLYPICWVDTLDGSIERTGEMVTLHDFKTRYPNHYYDTETLHLSNLLYVFADIEPSKRVAIFIETDSLV